MIATVNDFIKFVGRQEAIELSRVDDPGLDTVDTSVIQRGLDEAMVVLLSDTSESWSQFKICQLRIARYFLDPYTGREIVKQGYIDAMNLVKQRNKKFIIELG